MKDLVAVWLAVAAAGCGGGAGSAGDAPMAIGRVQASELLSPAYPGFTAGYDTATVAPDFVDLLRASQEGVEVIVVLGTWCGDSKREVPRFLRIAERAGIPLERIALIGVDRAKNGGDVDVSPYAVERVPTFIFRKAGKEIGRIVESPATTLEADMLTILAGAGAP